jgi:hypothetical protein
MTLFNAGGARHYLPGRAIAALEGISLYESGLQRMKLVPLRQAFDG